MRRQVALPLVVLLAGLGVTAATAQPPPAPGGGPAVQPPFSPYLNLLRQGSSPAANYFGLVRPQQQFAGSLQGLQQTTAQLGATAAGSDQLPNTGVGFGFQTQRSYFQNQYNFGAFNNSNRFGPTGAGGANRPQVGGAAGGQSAPAHGAPARR